MEQEKAREIIQTLAEGLDPMTGEVFPAMRIFQHADRVRVCMRRLGIYAPGGP